jgi:hypothetical protein
MEGDETATATHIASSVSGQLGRRAVMNTRMDRIAALGGVAYVVRSMMAIFEAPLSDMDNVRRPAVRRTSRRR